MLPNYHSDHEVAGSNPIEVNDFIRYQKNLIFLDEIMTSYEGNLSKLINRPRTIIWSPRVKSYELLPTLCNNLTHCAVVAYWAHNPEVRGTNCILAWISKNMMLSVTTYFRSKQNYALVHTVFRKSPNTVYNIRM